MFWRMTGLSTTSPVPGMPFDMLFIDVLGGEFLKVDSILDKENYTLDELLDEDEIIQECKALNSRLINFLRERMQVEQLVRYIVEEPHIDSEKRRIFKFPFIACEIFTCEVDVILKTLIEDEELMSILFSFLEPDRSHSPLLSGYFSKVVICLMLRKTIQLMSFIQGHKEILHRLVELIGITSMMEVLVRLVGADDHIYTNYVGAMQWLDDTDVLEMIVDKFNSSDSPEVHANAAETLCAIIRCAPSALATKIASPSFIGKLLGHALDGSRPKSVLVHSLSVCIGLLDPRRIVSSPSYLSRGQLPYGSLVIANRETVDGMLEKLGDLLKLLDVSSHGIVLPTTFGQLQPPLGKHRLKIVEFISVLLTAGTEASEKEIVSLGALRRVINLFFEYPFNNFLHHNVENILISCLESKKTTLIEHLMKDCHLIGKILEAEKIFRLSSDLDKPTSSFGKVKPKIGNIGHLTRMENKIIQLGNSNPKILGYLQENNEWSNWQTNVLLKRNNVENIYQWACGRPNSLQGRTRDSDDDDLRDRDFDVAALTSNLSQAFRYGIYANDDNEEVQGPLEREDEDTYFNDDSAEVVISSLRLGDDHDSGSLFTNSNWFAFEADRSTAEQMSDSLTSPTPSTEDDEVVVGEDDLGDTASSCDPSQPTHNVSDNGMHAEVNDTGPKSHIEGEKPHDWVEWRESSDLTSSSRSNLSPTVSVNGQTELICGNGANHYLASDIVISTLANNLRDNPCPGDPSTSMFDDIELVAKEETADPMELDTKEGVEHAVSNG